jgi:membrane-bound metal-dependent hydrolase YbcI (DUF457 family)
VFFAFAWNFGQGVFARPLVDATVTANVLVNLLLPGPTAVIVAVTAEVTFVVVTANVAEVAPDCTTKDAGTFAAI